MATSKITNNRKYHEFTPTIMNTNYVELTSNTCYLTGNTVNVNCVYHAKTNIPNSSYIIKIPYIPKRGIRVGTIISDDQWLNTNTQIIFGYIDYEGRYTVSAIESGKYISIFTSFTI